MIEGNDSEPDQSGARPDEEGQPSSEKTRKVSKKGAFAIVAAAVAIIAPSHVIPLLKKLGKKARKKRQVKKLKEAL